MYTYAGTLNLQNIKANEEFSGNMFFDVHSIPSPTGKQSYYLFLSSVCRRKKTKRLLCTGSLNLAYLAKRNLLARGYTYLERIGDFSNRMKI